jgi:hypothetical protein
MFDLLKFVRTNFRKWFVVLLWITVISLTLGGLIGGWNIGKTFFANSNDSNQYLGAIIGSILGGALGVLIGLFSIIVGGGLIATFLNVDENLQRLVKSENKSTQLNKNDSKVNHDIENINARWKCPKCNNENPNSTYQCGSCGYKLV